MLFLSGSLFQPDRGKPAVRLLGGGVETWSDSLMVI
jgi:hypothetical protein